MMPEVMTQSMEMTGATRQVCAVDISPKGLSAIAAENGLSGELLLRIEKLIKEARQITGADLAEEAGISLVKLRLCTKVLAQAGIAHPMRGRRYIGGLWAPGRECAGEHERGAVQLRVRVKNWRRAGCRIDVAEALLFNRFPALTAELFSYGSAKTNRIRLPKTA